MRLNYQKTSIFFYTKIFWLKIGIFINFCVSWIFFTSIVKLLFSDNSSLRTKSFSTIFLSYDLFLFLFHIP